MTLLEPVTSEPPYRRVIATVKELARGLQDELNANPHAPRLRIVMDPGHLVNWGQQLNILAVIDDRDFRDVLFRVYVPPDTGYPVSLDLIGPELRHCQTADELTQSVRDFLNTPEIRNRLEMLREIAA